MENNIVDFCLKTESVYGILDIFKKDFLNSFKNINSKERPPIIKAMPYLYRMWYYSALISDSVLSPANFISRQIDEKFDADTIVVPVSLPIYKNKILKDFNFEYLTFSIDNHPFLKDLKLFLDNCTPDIGVDESGLLLSEERDKIINLVSFKEIFYITFLTNTCYSLKLLKKMRGINTYRAMPETQKIEEFFNLSSTDQLHSIVDVTITNASKALGGLLPYDKKTFSKEAMSKLFTDSLDIDNYMDDIYKKFNINIDNLNNLDLSNISDISDINDLGKLNISEETLTSIFLKLELSFIMDAYLLTPLGYYLQLIRPLYYESTNFDIQFHELIQSTKIPDFPLIKLFFTISSSYDITSLGKKVLLNGSSPKNEYQLLKDLPDFKTIYRDITDYISNGRFLPLQLDEEFFKSLDDLDSMKESKNITNFQNMLTSNSEVVSDKNKAYSFKVKHFYNKRSYKTIELRGSQSLEDLAHSIIINFSLDYGHLYSFFMNNKAYDSEYEITSPFSNTNNKNITPKYKIYSLALSVKQKFLFLYDFGDDIKFEIEFLGTDELKKNVKYPRITKQSKN